MNVERGWMSLSIKCREANKLRWSSALQIICSLTCLSCPAWCSCFSQTDMVKFLVRLWAITSGGTVTPVDPSNTKTCSVVDTRDCVCVSDVRYIVGERQLKRAETESPERNWNQRKCHWAMRCVVRQSVGRSKVEENERVEEEGEKKKREVGT